MPSYSIHEVIRVLLADDHPLMRKGIRTSLEEESDIMVVGEAADGQAAQRMSQRLQPDVLLLDLSMPGPSALETMNYLYQHCPTVKIVILTAHDDEVYMRHLIAAGAAGYVLKDETDETLVHAIRVIMSGDQWFSRSVVEKLSHVHEAHAGQELALRLTDREQEILMMIAQGLSNAVIASRLDLAEQTVRNYASRLYTALGVRSRAEAIVWAKERGLVA